MTEKLPANLEKDRVDWNARFLDWQIERWFSTEGELGLLCGTDGSLELISSQPTTFKELRQTSGDISSDITLRRVRFRVNKSLVDEQAGQSLEERLASMSIGNDLVEAIQTDEDVVEVILTGKKTTRKLNYWEKYGLARLHELGIPAITAIYNDETEIETEPESPELDEKLDGIVTVLKPKIEPVSNLPIVDAPEEYRETMASTFRNIGRMHRGGMVHGDAHMRNFLLDPHDTETTVHIIDPDRCIDYALLREGFYDDKRGYAAVELVKGEVRKERRSTKTNKIDRVIPSQNPEEFFRAAVITDFRLFLGDFRKSQNLDERYDFDRNLLGRKKKSKAQEQLEQYLMGIIETEYLPQIEDTGYYHPEIPTRLREIISQELWG